MKAVYISKNLPHLAELREVDVPKPADAEVLIRNVTTSSNPIDVTLPLVLGYEALGGGESAGTVVEVGQNVNSVVVGDRVAAFTVFMAGSGYSSYAEYTVAPANTVTKLPPNINFEQGTSLPITFGTAALCLLKKGGVREPESASQPAPTYASGEVYIVAGAATSLGAYATQLAKLCGLQVIGTAGSNLELAREWGCDAVIDYKGKTQEELAEAIIDKVKAIGGEVVGALDASGDRNVAALQQALSAIGGEKKLSLVIPKGRLAPDLVASKPENVDQVLVTAAVLHAYHGNKFGPPEDEFAAKWYTGLSSLLEKQSIRPNKIRVIPGGLSGVQEGLRLIRENRVAGEKLVYRIAETSDLA